MQKEDIKKDATQPRVKKKWLLITAISGSALVVTLLTVAGLLTHGTIKSEYQQSSVAVDAPVEVRLSQRLLQVPLDKIEMTPEVKGAWAFERSLTGGDVLRFTPENAFLADTTYTVKFHDVRRITGIGVELPEMVFGTETAPGVADVSFKDKATVAADAVFSMSLSAKNRGLRDLELQTVPKLALTMSTQDDTTFTWKADRILPQGKSLKLTLVDKNGDKVLLNREVKVAGVPQLASKPAASNFGKNDTATITFKQAMDQTSGKILFSTEGDGVWKNDKTYVFTPTKIAPGKTYTYTIPKGLRSKEGGIIEKAKKYHFSTPGAVTVAGFSPYGQELSQRRQTIRVSFNQAVDKKSAEARVSLSRGTVEARYWEGNTLVITAVNFGVQQSVYVTVEAGIKPVFGLPSTQSFRGSFTTEIPIKKLNVPMYYQQYAQSCEAASLRMALAYKGAGSPGDWSILQRFGYDPRPMDKEKNEWDDPQKQFVGDVKGSQGDGTGWGVYAEPVARTARSYGRGATAQYGVSASFVAGNIYKGNPVILWGIWNESATQRSWKTPEGKTVSGPVPMHVRLVVGVKGRADNPVGFYIHDPITGPTYWTKDYLIYNTQRAGAANMAVAVQ